VLDHFIVPSIGFESSISSVVVLHDADNQSDHDPVQITLHMDLISRGNTMPEQTYCSRPAWFKASAIQVDDMYKRQLRDPIRINNRSGS